MEMSIHRALAELKLLDKRIEKSIDAANFVGVIKGSEEKVAQTNLTKEEFKIKTKSTLDSIQSLIKRRNKIKTLIVESNAKTLVNIAGNTYTVAAAIERKSSIYLEERLLVSLKYSYANASKTLERNNNSMESQLNTHLTTMLGKDNKNIDLIQSMSAAYRKENTYELVSGINIEGLIESMEKEIDDFKTEVDYVLSTSNAIQTITLED